MENLHPIVDRLVVVGTVQPDRIIELRKARGLSQEELARRTSSTQPSITRLEGGGTSRPRNLLEIARELETSPEYLLGETDDPSPTQSKPHEPREAALAVEDDDLVEINEIDLKYGMGATFIGNPVNTERRRFSKGWIRNFTKAPTSSLFWAVGDGDSMEPTIRSGEVILIDSSQDTPRMAEGIWAVALGEFGMIKRLHTPALGELQLLSDNKSIPPISVAQDELHIIGRVVAVMRRL